METLKRFLEFEIISVGDYHVKLFTILTVFLILLITRLLLWIIKKSLFRKQTLQGLDRGNIYAIFQIIKYVVWVIAIGLTMETIGIKVTVLIAGSAALLVGIGLGLQQTFNDIISGIILLSERTIKVDDILEIDGDIVKIQGIGLRTSKGLNRDDISIIIPNSLITTNKVINWSHQNRKTRFKINVGVAYGSNIDLVEKVLVDSVLEHPEISDKILIEARFLDFNNSSLDFQVLFFSEEVFRIEKIKSDIRKIINRKFIEHGIKIPFPQLDLHLMSHKNSLGLE
ncbi:MAG: mechanosensitive ion channel [Saprospiraceae bacterium]|nr:mechanosensitive ion channel [Saprospiraceae bacterium]